jgi:23S rRNA pseudouridine955/2504/2580 synthase
MKTFVISVNDAGQRLDRFVQKVAPRLPAALLQKSIRIKRIKVNGRRATNAAILCEGDLVELYLNDEFFPPLQSQPAFMAARRGLDIVYEDQNLLLADKQPGLVVHEDDEGAHDTLILRIQRHLYEKGEYDPAAENSFAPALCNRIDRNTGGIVIAAKNAATLRVINDLLRGRLVRKYYLCILLGRPSPACALLEHYLRRDEANRRVEVFDTPQPGARTALTRYRVLLQKPAAALVEIELLTGRTHQIRAQMAHVGHPLLGDAKYGRAADSRGSGFSHQALYAYRLMFDAGDRAGHLRYLDGRMFEVPRVAFAEDFYNGRFDSFSI